MKRCPDCKKLKANKEFPKDKSRADGLAAYCRMHCNQRAVERRAAKRKYQPTGVAIFQAVNRAPRSDSETELMNWRAYWERRESGERPTCAFGGCITPLRYRSPYAPYCERHGVPERRMEAREAS